jgi:hypothetical protein
VTFLTNLIGRWFSGKRCDAKKEVYSSVLGFLGDSAFPSRKPTNRTMKVPKTPASKVEMYGSANAEIA